MAVLSFLLASPALAAVEATEPVTPGASPEARALLQVLRSISGVQTLVGQHNFPNTRSRNSEFVKLAVGETPAVYSQDFGFAEGGDKDSYLARPDIVAEAKRQYEAGAIVTLCWHAAPPTADEPVTFRPAPGPSDPPRALASVQGRLTDEQWRDLLTPGTALNGRWLRQVDTIAGYLAQLRDARVPVLWRPYHEMNGDWFWWGGRTGRDSTTGLYRQMFERFTKHHKLDNLVWVWSVDRPGEHATSFESMYPGEEFVDVLALDVYGADFRQSYYDGLLALAKGRPVVLGEVGNPPTLDVLEQQPRWAMYVVWAGLHRSTPLRQHLELARDPRVLYLEDAAYWDAIAPLRRLAGRPATQAENVHLDQAGRRVDFSGTWLIDEERSDPGAMGSASALRVYQRKDEIVVRRTVPAEYEDDAVTEEATALDGTPRRSASKGATRVTAARWSQDGDTLRIESKITLDWGGTSSEVTAVEEWRLVDDGRGLAIEQTTTSPWGTRSATLVFARR